jgi:hypothetical protein
MAHMTPGDRFPLSLRSGWGGWGGLTEKPPSLHYSPIAECQEISKRKFRTLSGNLIMSSLFLRLGTHKWAIVPCFYYFHHLIRNGSAWIGRFFCLDSLNRKVSEQNPKPSGDRHLYITLPVLNETLVLRNSSNQGNDKLQVNARYWDMGGEAIFPFE